MRIHHYWQGWWSGFLSAVLLMGALIQPQKGGAALCLLAFLAMLIGTWIEQGQAKADDDSVPSIEEGEWHGRR